MKKLLAFITCLVLAMGLMAMAACGGGEEDATFKGNYQQINRAAATAFAEEVQSDSDVFGFKTGMELKFNMEGGSGDEYFYMEYDLKCASENGMPSKMAGSTVMKMGGFTVKGNVYYTDGYMYVNSMGQKIKMAMDYDEYIEEQMGMGGASALMSIQDVLEYVGEEAETSVGNIKIYLDQGETVNKLKIEFKGFDMGDMKIDGAYYFVYNTNGELTAFKTDAKMTIDGYKTSFYMVAKAFDGNISLPSNLDTYIETNDY